MLARLVAGGRSTGMRSPSSSRSCSTNPSGSRIFTISAGCSVPRRRAEMMRWAPSSSGCRGCVGGSVTSTVTPRPAGLKSRSTRSRSKPCSITRPRTITSSMPSSAVMRVKRSMIAPASSGPKSITRPDVEQQAVPQQALARAAAGLHRAHRLERLPHRALELRDRRDRAGLVAHRRQVAHLGQRDEPLVARVLARRRRGRGAPRARRAGARARSSRAARSPSARPSSGACRAGRCTRASGRRRGRR